MITVTEKMAASKLPDYKKELIELRMGKQFYLLSKEEKYKVCFNVVSMVHAKTGDKGAIDSNILTFQTNELLGELNGKLGQLTEAEIIKAFENGYRGEYGNFFGLNAKTYHNWLKSFLEAELRASAWLEYLSLIEQQNKPEMTKEEHRIKNIETCKRYFNEYKQTGRLGQLAPWLVYDTIKELKGVKSLVDVETFKKHYAILAPSWNEMLRKEKSKAERRGHISQIEVYCKIISEGLDKYDSFQRAIKRELLTEYFNKIDTLEL